MSGQEISLAEAADLSGVSASTLKRWAEEGVVPLENGAWTRVAAAQARVVARMRERGYSLESVKEAAGEGRLAFGFAEDLFDVDGSSFTTADAAERTGLEEQLIARIMTLLGTPMGKEGVLNEADMAALSHIAQMLESGFPLVALLQLVRVYAQAIR